MKLSEKNSYKNFVNYRCNDNLNLLKKVKKNILINGGSGFLASQLIYFFCILKKDFKIPLNIYVVTRDINKLKKKTGSDLFKQINYLQKEETIFFKKFRIDFFFYFSSPANHNSRKGDFLQESLDQNVLKLKKILKNKKKFCLVFMSSNVIQQNMSIIENSIFLENNKVNHRVCYDLVKILSEYVIEKYSKNYFIIRPDLIYGPGESLKNGRFFSDFIDCLLKNKSFNLRANINDTRSFMFVTDFIVSLLKIISSEKKNKKYVIGNYKLKYNMVKLAEKISRSFKLKLKKVNSNLQITNPKKQKVKLFNYQNKKNICLKTSLDQSLNLTIDYYKNVYSK